MKFNIQHAGEDNTTFSPEGILAFMSSVHEFIDKQFAMAIRKGFDDKEPINNIEIEVTMMANGKEVDWDELISQYPEHIQFDYRYIAETILNKFNGDDK